jgi:hypothetical protein
VCIAINLLSGVDGVHMAREIRNGIRFELGDAGSIRGTEYANEHNDCTVRAISKCAGVPYVDGHNLCARLGRKPRKGMTEVQLSALVYQPHVYGYKVTRVVLPGLFASRLGRAVSLCARGRYLIIKTGHAIACIDGVLYDTGASGAGSRVLMVFKFTPTSEWEAIARQA